MELEQKIKTGQTVLGIELGSTNIKAILLDTQANILASSSYNWKNEWDGRFWTYSEEKIWEGIGGCYQQLKQNVLNQYGVLLSCVGTIGISAMMHGYLVFDERDELIVPFRTWRNNHAQKAATILSECLQSPIASRWSVAQLYQAIIDKEEHVEKIKHMTTLSGYVHWKLTGKKQIGIGDASGMFPVDSDGMCLKKKAIHTFQNLINERGLTIKIDEILPEIVEAGEKAAQLTEQGAKFLDSSGDLQLGSFFCAPEGDAQTGMVATNSLAEGSANVSAGTSIFLMSVLEKPLQKIYPQVDVVLSPAGKHVAMIHANNGSSDIDQWIGLFYEIVKKFDPDICLDVVYQKCFESALIEDDCTENIVACGYVSAEHITGFEKGYPFLIRLNDSNLTLASVMRAHLQSALASLRIGWDILSERESVTIKHMVAHGGYFKTPIVGQMFLASALKTRVYTFKSASQGGSYGIALLALFSMKKENGMSLEKFVDKIMREKYSSKSIDPDPKMTESFERYMNQFKKGLEVEKKVVELFSE